MSTSNPHVRIWGVYFYLIFALGLIALYVISGNENAVHSLDHGAVWITYRSDLPHEQIGSLRQLARRQPYVMVSPLPDCPHL